MSKPLVIVGDSMLDVDIEGSATRLSPEAPVPVVDADRLWQRPGGAGLAAVLAARIESGVVLVTAIAEDDDGRRLTELLTAAGITVVALPMAGSTVCKTRIRASGQSMLRLDHGDGIVVGQDLPASVSEVLGQARAICVADYGRGVSAHPGLRQLLEDTATRVPLVWDPHPRGAPPVPGCWLVTPNQSEAQGVSAETLRRQWRARAVSVTLGDRGATVSTDDGGLTDITVPVSLAAGSARSDTCGAGDRFAVAATLALAEGNTTIPAVTEAVSAASRFVATGGAVGVSTPGAIGANGGTPEFTAILGEAAEVRDRLRRRGGRLIATGGCFDLLHTGHIRLLHRARQLGDALVVLLNSDDSVRALKGPSRPVMAQADRARVLCALACVDAVVIFGETSPEQQLEVLRPDVWVKGGDYAETDLPEASVVRSHGGDVVLLPTIAGYSSSKLIAAMRS
ncbi:adenylyltransferase/cytidyltransferase family protein [Mycolicibacterium farcinogenes]|uniref:Adenylyltransferase/cytidyltransferase family protein n=1 Tax=Mycolicibacterium farcinogenes TaxID=1802 RepID=A0ACD1FD25_MYCFR|nr:PfkB family carbohydrate kinase [Mycolicibacterium farcinogenes]QZH58054.1 adenylyltransferase/cytidyltransferase family protein [Mycolicibacterium farcinogenes]QZH64947.1 adenylyltransferase/cytidyltransferase family protein [Mycolicibacterium farcinogenes]